MLEAFPVFKYQIDPQPLASSQPYCPKARAYLDGRLKDYNFTPAQSKLAQELIEQNKYDTESIKDIFAMEMGTIGHAIIQRSFAKNFHVLANWECLECGFKAQICFKPEHPHPLQFVEIKLPVPGSGRNCKADMILYTQDNEYVLYEFKFPKYLPKVAKRAAVLQANLTAYTVATQLGISIKRFVVHYIDRANFEEREFPFWVDPELAAIQMELMASRDPNIGVCRSPGDYWCPFKEICFHQDLPHHRNWLNNSGWTNKLAKLKGNDTIL